jgi:hypothetical protein
MEILVISGVVTLLSIIALARIIYWYMLDHKSQLAKNTLIINLFIFVIYSGVFFLPAYYSKSTVSNPDSMVFDNGFVLVFWVFVGMIQLIFYGAVAEAGIRIYKAQQLKKPIENLPPAKISDHGMER